MKIIVTGAAGLVGRNLILSLRECCDGHIVAIDEEINNLERRARLKPDVETIVADLVQRGRWKEHFNGADAVVLLHAQIGRDLPELIKRRLAGWISDLVGLGRIDHIAIRRAIRAAKSLRTSCMRVPCVLRAGAVEVRRAAHRRRWI